MNKFLWGLSALVLFNVGILGPAYIMENYEPSALSIGLLVNTFFVPLVGSMYSISQAFKEN